MLRTTTLASIAAVLAGAVLLPAAAQQAGNPTAATAAAHRETLQLYCIGCHSGPTPFAGLNLEPLNFANLEANGDIWEKLIRKLRGRQMPPAGMPRPEEATYDALVKYIETGRDRLAEVKPNPGRATLHRLNRTEYANAIRDLLALEIDVANLLPADDIGYGFDNIGDVLSVSPLLMERYLATAAKISRQAVGDPAMPVNYQQQFGKKDIEDLVSYIVHEASSKSADTSSTPAGLKSDAEEVTVPHSRDNGCKDR